MKKVLFYFAATLMLPCVNVHAQISAGGTPLAMTTVYSDYILPQSDLPQVSLTAPDVAALLQQDTANHKLLKPFRIGALMPADISFPDAGSLATLPDGNQVWRVQISMPGAKALGLYYDKFHLPAGVKLFLYNANDKQILGAYTADNNPGDNLWATEKTQGSLVNVEMDIEAGVKTDDIQMHINNVCDFYQGADYLGVYASSDNAAQKTTQTYFPYGGSSPCEINALCPLGNTFPNQRSATVHIEYTHNGFAYGATGTLMNNTSQNCTPYVLTASHVEPTNSTADNTFSNWIFYFNYQTPTCIYNGPQPNISQTIIGANFKARASYDSASDQIVGDFLLVALRHAIPATYNAYLAGWDRTGNTPVGSVISYHHPSADVKKVASAASASPNGNFNGGQQHSHWQVIWDQGGTEEGSSGSGLFNTNGRLIGDLSGGAPGATCDTVNSSGVEMSGNGEYSKLSLNWNYTFEVPSTSATRLHDWLDSANTGATVLDAIVTPCAVDTTTGIQTVKTFSADLVSVYPNPTSGITYISLNLPVPQNVTIEVFNIVGAKELEMNLSNVQQGAYKVDLSSYATGMYLVKVTEDGIITNKKVILSR